MTEVVITAEKLPLDGFKDIKDDLDKVYRISRIVVKRLEAEDNPKKALKLKDKLEED
jgi:hypothetical protein